MIPISAFILTATPADAVEIFGWDPMHPFGGNKQEPQNPKPTAREEDAAAGGLKRAEAAEARGDMGEAAKIYREVLKGGAFTAAAPKAQFKLAKALEQQGDLKGAFNAYKTYTTNYPRGGEFDTVINAQFNIAKTFLGGQKKKVLGVPVGPSYERAEEMFRDIVKFAPFHRLAPLAQFNIGQALEKQDKPQEALGAYQEVITRYPSDPVADDAHYQMGYVKYKETKEGSRDQTSRVQARDAFEDFVNRYPESEKVSQARENLKTLGGTDVKGTLEIAQYYDKTKNYKAAAVYYNEVVRIAPGTPESEKSRKRIDELKGIVGADALRTGPEKAQSGDTALARRRALARVDVASRPDYAGPLVKYPYPTDRPSMRTTPLGPIVEPALPTGDPLQTTPGDPLVPNLPPPPDEAGKRPPAEKKPTPPAKPEAEKKPEEEKKPEPAKAEEKPADKKSVDKQ